MNLWSYCWRKEASSRIATRHSAFMEQEQKQEQEQEQEQKQEQDPARVTTNPRTDF